MRPIEVSYDYILLGYKSAADGQHYCLPCLQDRLGIEDWPTAEQATPVHLWDHDNRQYIVCRDCALVFLQGYHKRIKAESTQIDAAGRYWAFDLPPRLPSSKWRVAVWDAVETARGVRYPRYEFDNLQQARGYLAAVASDTLDI